VTEDSKIVLFDRLEQAMDIYIFINGEDYDEEDDGNEAQYEPREEARNDYPSIVQVMSKANVESPSNLKRKKIKKSIELMREFCTRKRVKP
jgi:predicted RNA-binding protein with PUA-like domain